ncbi:MAG: MEDS domain-containing protein [Candidatus Nitrosomaritimum aestuariumsis]|uniref:MEDS domain-containing protein n=2 Tax=Candidatus Nitrosomaritimum aestuariumsis TaxID=3342354 RepID=A0AC60W8G3_9ARCH|nr:MEDS domain-containing protein [Nitrosopumilaceae archaeon]
MSQSFFEYGKKSGENYLKKMDKDRHLLLVYEDFEKAIDLQINYLKRGLENGEVCILAMPYEFDMEQKMKLKGIEVEKYKKKNLLYIFKDMELKEPSSDLFSKFSKKILSVSSKPLRICAMLNIDMSTKEGMNAFLEAETASHAGFQTFRGSWLCSYDIKKMEKEEKIRWVKKLLKCHDSVIFAPSHESGIAMDLS